jgi:arabinofuranosyltransferase
MVMLNRFGIFTGLLIFLLLVLCFSAYTTDDSYISYRYAENMANGHGLVFNRYQTPVEGYTNFLWTLLLSAIATVKLPLPETASFLSLFFSVALLLLMAVWAHMQREFNPDFPIAVPVLLLASSPALALWSVTGMETPFFAFLLVSGAVFLSIEERRSWPGILSGLTFALAALARPEGLLIGGIVIGFSYIFSRQWYMRLPAFIIRVILFALPPALHFLWRKSFYGHWFPNTFYAKTTTGTELFGLGFDYLKGFLFQGGLVLVVLIMLALFIRRKTEGLWTILVLITVYSLYVVWIGGDWMPANRLFLPILPFMIMGASVFIAKTVHVSGRFTTILTALICLHFIYHGISAQLRFMNHSVFAQTFLNHEPPVDVLKALGLHLREVADPSSVVAVVPAGKVPFYSGLKAIDMRGLCDHHIARQPFPDKLTHILAGHFKRDDEYVLSQKPDFIVLSGAARKESAGPLEISSNLVVFPVLDEWTILSHPEFISNYREVREPLHRGDRDLLYFERNRDDSEKPDSIPEMLLENDQPESDQHF